MKSQIIAALTGTAFLIYIIVFVVYRIHKNTTCKSIVRESKLAIAERLIYWAFRIMPDSKEKLALGKFIIDYSEKAWEKEIQPSKPISLETLALAITNNIPDVIEDIKNNKSVELRDCTHKSCRSIRMTHPDHGPKQICVASDCPMKKS